MAEDPELVKRYNKLYLDVIMRYRDHIEESEHMHLAELPKLVTPDDEVVAAEAKNITSKLPTYRYDDNFPDAAKLAYEYVRDRIVQASLPIQFWLTPKQTISDGAGDVFDKAVLLCSLLIAMGNKSTRIIVRTRDDAEDLKFVVYSEYKNRILAIDMQGGYHEYANKDDMLNILGIKDGGDINAYEFNDKMYTNLP